MTTALFRLACLVTCFLGMAQPSLSASPGSSEWFPGTGAKLRLVSGSSPVFGSSGDQARWAGLQMVLDKGVTTYWRAPGDSGIAPKFDWSRSRNIASVDVLWPAPSRHDLKGDVTNVYQGEAVWPLRVHPQNPAEPARLVLHMTYAVCSDICIPGEANLSLDLDTSSKPAAEGKTLIEAAMKKVPLPLPNTREINLRFTGVGRAHIEARLKQAGAPPDLFAEGPEDMWVGKPVVTRQGEWLIYTMPVEGAPAAPVDVNVRLTLVEPDAAYETTRSVR